MLGGVPGARRGAGGRGWAEPGAAQAAPGSRSESELAGDAAGAAPTAAEHADQLTGVEAEALEDARVLVRVDLVGQLAVGLRDLVVLAARPQQLEDLLLGYLHAGRLPAAAGAESPRRRFADPGGARALGGGPPERPARGRCGPRYCPEPEWCVTALSASAWPWPYHELWPGPP